VHVVRAGLLTVPAVGFATLAHVLVDSCVSVVAIGVAAAVCWPAAVILLRAQRRCGALIGWLTIAQGVTHLLLEQMCGDASPAHMGVIDHLLMGLSAAMLLTHAGSVLFTAALFGRADAGLWTAQALVNAGARALDRLAACVRPAPLPQRPSPVPVVGLRRPRPSREAGTPLRRGPPALLAA